MAEQMLSNEFIIGKKFNKGDSLACWYKQKIVFGRKKKGKLAIKQPSCIVLEKPSVEEWHGIPKIGSSGFENYCGSCVGKLNQATL